MDWLFGNYREKRCTCCQRKFIRGMEFDAIEHYDKHGRKDRWFIAKRHKKIFLCEKCFSVGMALIRGHLALKTGDIIDE